MTVRKHFKKLVRTRMARTGESYATARRQLLRQADPEDTGPFHFTGSVPAATALRTLLTHAGVRDPHTGRPFTEAMAYGLAGGIGIGVFAFHYEREGFSSFFVAGRHRWHDSLAYLSNALGRFGITPTVRETGGPKAAEKALRETVAEGPCVAWVDMASLPHRGLPAAWAGGGYHVVTVHKVEADGTAHIGDLTDELVAVPGPAFAAARGRIKKDKNRLLSIAPAAVRVDLAGLVRDGLRACHGGLNGEGAVKAAQSNFRLDALGRWADRLHGDASKDGWERVFPPGSRLWRGLTSVALFVEAWGTGGGLGRPLFAEFLREAADALKDDALRELAGHYDDLGRGWSELAAAALPAGIPEFQEARELHARVGEATHGGGEPDAARAAWQRLDELERRAAKQFPLSADEAAALRADLQGRVRALYEAETAAHAVLGRLVG
jgi:hypothetical protein